MALIDKKYIIVGIESDVDKKGVVKIGQMLAEMSERKAPDRYASQAEEDTIKSLMSVQGLEKDNDLTDTERNAIHAALKVKVRFETRDETGDTRILVVPADGALATRAQQFQDGAEPDASKDLPPLAYDTDRKAMMEFIGNVLLTDGMLASLKTKDPAKPKEWQDGAKAMLDHLRQATKQDNSKARRLMLYYRGVGIYATNMCR